MKHCVYNTGPDWIEFLKSRGIRRDVNFWRLDRRILRLDVGAHFYFKERGSPWIVGRGQFVENVNLTVTQAWRRFGYGNGCGSEEQFKDKVGGGRVNCIVLTNLEWLTDPVQITKAFFPAQVEGAKYYSDDEIESVATGFASDRPQDLPHLDVGRGYSWMELGAAFSFNPDLFRIGGGMLSRPEFGALLLITHPGGARSIDYDDKWEGDDTLIYTGRGKRGNQQLKGPNRDVAENQKRLLVFEQAGSRQLRYCGEAHCQESWRARAVGTDDQQRTVFKFRLRFRDTPSRGTSSSSGSTNLLRQPRSFDPDSPPNPRAPRGTKPSTPDETAALQEKATQDHFQALSALHASLIDHRWQNVEEIPSAIDLRATSPDGAHRVIFEVKTISASNELHQCRAALSQLLEYRFFHGEPADELCLVVNGPIADHRRVFLESLGVGVAQIHTDGAIQAIGLFAGRWPLPFGSPSSP